MIGRYGMSIYERCGMPMMSLPMKRHHDGGDRVEFIIQ